MIHVAVVVRVTQQGLTSLRRQQSYIFIREGVKNLLQVPVEGKSGVCL